MGPHSILSPFGLPPLAYVVGGSFFHPFLPIKNYHFQHLNPNSLPKTAFNDELWQFNINYLYRTLSTIIT
jgi:hypothetical protein